MQYNDTTNNTGVIQMIEQTSGLGLTGISGSVAKLAYFTNLVNQWHLYAAIFAWTTDKNWKLDDSNKTTRMAASRALVNNQRDYTLPTDFLKIQSVEVKDSAGKYQMLQLLPENSITSEQEQEDQGMPTHYRLEGRSLILYPIVDINQVTAAAGLRVTPDARNLDAYDTFDTTKTPGLDKPFWPILYLGPSFEYASINGVPHIANACEKMLGQWPGLFEIMKKFYDGRNRADKASMLNNPYLFDNFGE